MVNVHAEIAVSPGMSETLIFSYATSEGGPYTTLFEVDGTSSSSQSAELPGGVVGTVFLRVEDGDRSNGDSGSDYVEVDHLYIVSDSAIPDAPLSLIHI